MFNPPITGNKDLDAYLYDISLNIGEAASTAAEEPNIPAGDPGSYPYQYIQIKYATDNVGTGFSNVPTGKTYFGIYNSSSSVESTNPADYTWYLAGVPFGTINFLYYLILGGRKIKFAVNTALPDYRWKQDDGNAVDLDIIVPISTVSFNELMNNAVTELKIAANAVTATKINVAALDQALGDLRPNTVSASQIATDAVTELKILNGAITNNKIGTAVITGDKIFANTITGANIAAETIGAGQIAAGAITAVKIQAGTITADRIQTGTITAASGVIGNAAILTANIGDLQVSTAKIADLGITDAKIANATITSAKINDLSVNKLTAGSISGGGWNGVVTIGGTIIPTMTIRRSSASNLAVFDVYENSNASTESLARIRGSSTPITLYVETDNAGSGAGIFKQLSTSKQFWAAPGLYSAYSPSGGGKYYFVDGAGPFTGCHDGMININESVDIGDIVVDQSIFYKHDISNVITNVTRSNIPNSKVALGIVSEVLDVQKMTPGCLWESYTYPNPVGSEQTDVRLVSGFDLEELQANYKVVQINALGEGQINVCGENGNIEAGDFIVTSSMLGKGMKQSDDIVRAITVAKARESVTFNSPTEIKQIACIYMGG